MRHKTLFLVLCIVMSVAIVFAVAVHRLDTPPAPLIGVNGQSSRHAASFGESSADIGMPLSESSGLLTGISLQVPDWDSMPLIAQIPWSRSDVTRRYNQAGRGRGCELFSADMQTFQKLLAVQPSVSSAMGRQPVFSVALTMEPAVRESLPQLSKAKIESYLEDHLLVLQTRLYHEKDGSVFYGDRLGAAFCSVKSPRTTLTPEPMIGQAVSEFRTLGLYSPPDAGETDRRTLLLAFRYSADDSGLTTGVARSLQEYELIFIHLLSADNANPAIAVFSTSGGRTQFHELETGDAESLIQTPSIVATVRFDDFTYMGLYPSKPVVTGIRQRARLSLPTESVRSRLLGLGDKEALNLCQLLDQLHREADGNVPAEGQSTAP
ncbi:MAG: hypothetical protein R3C59_01620 [Planctomycetaceae bacterium]